MAYCHGLNYLYATCTYIQHTIYNNIEKGSVKLMTPPS